MSLTREQMKLRARHDQHWEKWLAWYGGLGELEAAHAIGVIDALDPADMSPPDRQMVTQLAGMAMRELALRWEERKAALAAEKGNGQ